MIHARYNVIVLIICLLLAGTQACQPTGETPTGTKRVTVAPDGQLQQYIGAVNLEAAVQSATPGTEIVLQPGIYIVDNPVTLHTSDLVIRGAGRDSTRIVPKNQGQPVFTLAADNITLESITIDALLTDKSGHASHAIKINKNHGDCLIAHTKMLNAGASAVIGESAPGCTLVDNMILNSGDDAVQLRGDRLTVIGNTILRYFDEALDLAAGTDIIVTRNYVSYGRIGIVVDDSNKALIARNIVDNQLMQGIVTGTDAEAVVTGNRVTDAGHIAYKLQSPRAVTGNEAQGDNETGFRISSMDGGVISGNIVRDKQQGFVFINETKGDNETGFRIIDMDDGIVFGNTATGKQQDFVFIVTGEAVTDNEPAEADGRIIDDSPAPLIVSNCVQPNNTVTGGCPGFPGIPNTQTATSQLHDLQNDPEILSFAPEVDIQGTTSADLNKSRNVASLLKYYNPGFLSIHTDGTVMRSQITEDLYRRLLGAGQLGIGLVRAPFMSFSRGERSFYWYLSYAETDVIMVSSMHGGPRVRFIKLQNGEPGYMDSIVLFTDKLLLKFLP